MLLFDQNLSIQTKKARGIRPTLFSAYFRLTPCAHEDVPAPRFAQAGDYHFAGSAAGVDIQAVAHVEAGVVDMSARS